MIYRRLFFIFALFKEIWAKNKLRHMWFIDKSIHKFLIWTYGDGESERGNKKEKNNKQK